MLSLRQFFVAARVLFIGLDLWVSLLIGLASAATLVVRIIGEVVLGLTMIARLRAPETINEIRQIIPIAKR